MKLVPGGTAPEGTVMVKPPSGVARVPPDGPTTVPEPLPPEPVEPLPLAVASVVWPVANCVPW
jgi:hypothetical protein